MIEITGMETDEMQGLLLRGNFGHLGCTRDNHPYVVPMHYAYDSQNLYFLTTEGTKTEFISANGEVCFQVENVADASHWQSVMVIGPAERVSSPQEMEHAMQLVTECNPTLTPAINQTEIAAWHRLNKMAIYRVRPDAVYGRKTVS